MANQEPLDFSAYGTPATLSPPENSGAPDFSQYGSPAMPDMGATAGMPTFDPGGLPRSRDNAPEGFWQGARSMVTGEGKAEYDLPEFSIPGGEGPMSYALAQLGKVSTFDKGRELNSLHSNYPKLKFAEDKQGNIIVDGSAYGAETGYMNAPGWSVNDFAKAGFQVAAFTPAGRGASMAVGLGSKMLTTGVLGAATETGMDLMNQATGGTERVSPSNIDKTNVAIASAGGAAFEGLSVSLINALRPAWRAAKGQLTDEVRALWTNELIVNQGMNPMHVTDDLIRRYNDEAMAAMTQAGEDTSRFGISYTKGQASGDRPQLDFEEQAREGGKGAGAQRKLGMGTPENPGFQARQGEEIMQARGQVQADLAGQNRMISDQHDMAQDVTTGLQSRAGRLRQEGQDAYDQVGRASLKPEGQRNLINRLQRVVKINMFDVTEANLATNDTLKWIMDRKRFVDEMEGGLRPIHINRVEQMRRQLSANINSATNDTDRRQVTLIKNEFDKYIDRAINQSMFNGDQAVIDQLKKARSLHSEYMKRFTQNDTRLKGGKKRKDFAGEAIQTMVEFDPTPEQVINYFWSVNGIHGKQNAAKLAQRLKDELGPDSQEWSSIRQAAFLKLTDPGKRDVISGQKFLTNITDANDKSRTLFTTLFTPDEIGTFRNFARAVIRAQPELQNKSKSAHMAAKYVNDSFSQMATMMGGAAGGVPGAIIAKSTMEMSGGLQGLRNSFKAGSAAAGADFPLRELGPVGVTPFLTPAAVGAGSE